MHDRRPSRTLLLRALLLAGLLPAGSSHAQAVYRCSTKAGIAYQDRPCAGAQGSSVHVIRAAPAAETPPGVRQERAWVARNHPGRFGEPASVPLRGRRAAAPDREAEAYRCTSGSRVFFQYQPCPRLAPDGRAAFFRREPRPEELRPTAQERVSAREACEAQRAELDPYTRETTPNPCKRLRR
jgi:hypothetical protein